MSEEHMGGSGEFERQLHVEGETFQFEGTIEIKANADHPELVADELQNRLDECLAEFVLEQRTE